MSFSQNAKAELCKTPMSRQCCVTAEAYGVLLYCNMFTSREIRIVTKSLDFAQRLPKLFKEAFNHEFDTVPSVHIKGKQTFSITDSRAIEDIFVKFGSDAKTTLAHHINLALLEENCCKSAFLRGAFLAGGSISDPKKSYHLEIVTAHYNISRETFALLLELDFSPKDAARTGNYVIYFKHSEAIEDFFTLIGATVSSMGIMSTKVEKDMRNAINRRVNCDSANADKIVSAAQVQLDAIRRIERGAGLDSLPEKLKEAALLRIANPAASLVDLAALSSPPVSKSCVSHRLRKLMELSRQGETGHP